MNGKNENLLIDFNNTIVDSESSNVKHAKISTALIDDGQTKNEIPKSMELLCSSQPLYKLLQGSQSNDIEDNNPFDHLDKQVGLLDDPFEIVENAALISSQSNDTEVAGVRMQSIETEALISIDSPVIARDSVHNNLHSETIYLTPENSLSSNDSKRVNRNGKSYQNSSENISQKNSSCSKNTTKVNVVSPSGSTRPKAINTSLDLLKYSLSNSRLDLASENLCNDDDLIGAERMSKKQMSDVKTESGTDDSFDDIWATKPNLIDSQTDIEIDGDIDTDIAKLNIPMLNIGTEKINEHDDEDNKEVIEPKAVNRSNILEKFASIKQKIPQSPTTIQKSSAPPTMSIHNQTVDIKCSEERVNLQDEPMTPINQYSSVVIEKEPVPNNTNSLIENLKKMVDQCDDKSKQITAKHLLDDLSSILTKTGESKNNCMVNKQVEKQKPQLIKRQGTFSIEKEIIDDASKDNMGPRKVLSNECKNINTATADSNMDSGLSQVMKQIQNAFGSHQNINVLQSNDSSGGMSTSNSVNPTYIVVMAHPTMGFNEENTVQNTQRHRSQSLTLREKPLAATRANQHKIETSQVHGTILTTPIKRPVLPRRGSFGAISQIVASSEAHPHTKTSNVTVKPNAQKIIRRRSLQMLPVKQEEPETIQTKSSNTVIRRQSFQSIPTASGIRLPSPKRPSNPSGPTASLRMNVNTAGVLTRRKSFSVDPIRDSPHKIKSSYAIMKAPPPARNLKIRVSQTTSGRSTAPLRAVVPMKQVASLLLNNDTVSPVDDKRNGAIITSTPRSIPSPSKLKKGTMNFLFQRVLYNHFTKI